MLFHTRFHKSDEMPLLRSDQFSLAFTSLCRLRTTDQDSEDLRDEPSPCVIIKPPAAFHPRIEVAGDLRPLGLLSLCLAKKKFPHF